MPECSRCDVVLASMSEMGSLAAARERVPQIGTVTVRVARVWRALRSSWTSSIDVVKSGEFLFLTG